MTEHSADSTVREKTLEHIFVGECLRRLWAKGVRDSQVLRADADAAGYDIVLDAGGVLRYVQLKAFFNGAKTSRQTINTKLADKPSGCVVWMGFDAETLDLGPFWWFGGEPGQPLPSLADFKTARHTKGDSKGVKAERPGLRVVPRRAFTRLEVMDEVVDRLFGV